MQFRYSFTAQLRRGILVALVSLALNQFARASACQTTVFFGNGIWTTWQEAYYKERPALQYAVTQRLAQIGSSISIPSNCFQLAYDTYNNTTQSGLDQLLQGAIQIGLSDASLFWLFLAHAAPASSSFQQLFLVLAETTNLAAYISEVDLQTQVGQYATTLNAGSNIVVVSHSQGNLYANKAYDLLYPDNQTRNNFHIVAAATPDSFVAGGGPYTTLYEDTIASVGFAVVNSTVLPPNITNIPPITCILPWDCHSFLNSYLSGAAAGLGIHLPRQYVF